MAAPTKPRALLVQDPHRDRGHMARSVLQEMGFCVREAARGVEAVTVARGWTPQLILLDSQLRDVPGREVETWLRSHPALREVPIVLIGNEMLEQQRPSTSAFQVRLDHPYSSASLKNSIAQVWPSPQDNGVKS